MPSPEELKTKLLELIDNMATAEGVSASDILGALDAMPENDPTQPNNLPKGRTAAKDEDPEDMAQAQTKADSAYVGIGRRAPEPFSGEKAMDYRKRALRGLQSLAKKFSEVDIRSISDSATLAVLEDQIYQEAKTSVNWAHENSPGYLHRVIKTDAAGRRITEWKGDPNAWLAAFKTPPMRLVKINTPGSMR